ncbi:hypothetical protein [Burkholderia diffusa]|uniref:hypothetical protein n=1 Tax=Burkholderia diffusa TaxID=488732 RepID=UPI00157A7627|nr:hypothetical protein [Burkholderia diffusa]NTY35576.1 DUF3304 domain-containing protein [Burkholderia diffusa]
MRLFRLIDRVLAACLLLVVVAACGKSEPTYSGISVIGRNYLPYNMSGFTITDAFGNKASGGGDAPPGAGGGSVKCCYKLKGTEFVVKWNYYDVDQWHKGDKQMFHGETKVSMPQSQLPDEVGSRILEVHFFPDQHVEFQFPGQLLDDARLPIVDVVRWMKQYQSQLDKRYDEREDQQFRRVARVVAVAWLKYRLTDLDDLKQYAYFGLLVNDRFDAHPEVQHILQTAAGRPGLFAKSMQALPKSVSSELRSDKFEAVAVPAVAAGLLPPPRVGEKQHG